MHHFQSSVFINRPLHEVFDYMNDMDHYLKWRTNIVSAERSSEPGVGATIKTVSRVLGRNTETTYEYTAWDPPNMQSGRTMSGPKVETTTNWESQGEGTLVKLLVKIELDGIFKLFEGMVGKQIVKQNKTAFAILKQIMESGEV